MRAIGGSMGKVFVAIVVSVLFTIQSASAQMKLPDEVSAYSIEAETGLLLYEHNAGEVRAPASMIKLMLMLMVMEGVERDDWSLDTRIEASRKAQRMGGTQVYLDKGEVHSLENLMLAVSIASANDAAMAVAEGLWGDEESYLAAMNVRAQELGMLDSDFHSVHGLPPDRGEEPDRTTAHDMALLARACVSIPKILQWTSTHGFEFRPGEGKKYTTNKLVREMDECDGLKTGFIRASGFCITATATRDDIRVISVVMGYRDKKERFKVAERLLLDGLDTVRRDLVVAQDVQESPIVSVADSETERIELAIENELWITARAQDFEKFEVVFDHPDELAAPLEANTEVGEVRVEFQGDVLARSALLITEDVEEAGWVWKIERAVTDFFSVAD